MNHYSIAIDGPAASGKSTAAKGVAKILNFIYIDTGAMYRAVTLYMLEHSLDCKSKDDAISCLDGIDIYEDKNGNIFLNDKDVTKRVRDKDVTENVSYACAHQCVREKMVALQQKMASNGDVVMDGRDIGTVVLNDATLKIYQVASVKSRALRRFKENNEKGYITTLDQIEKDIEKRDYIDSHREFSPLCKASDAILLDTSDLTIEEEIQAILELFYKKVGKENG